MIVRVVTEEMIQRFLGCARSDPGMVNVVSSNPAKVVNGPEDG
jgi:hypothetical protein